MPKQPYTLTSQQSKLIELVRRLEKDGYDFGQNTDELIQTLTQIDDTPLNKLFLRSQVLDDGSLEHAIHHTQFILRLIGYLLSAVFFTFGFVLLFLLILKTSLAIYYLLFLVLIVNLIFMLRSFRILRSDGRLPFDGLYERFRPATAHLYHAYNIHLDARKHHAKPAAMVLLQSCWAAFFVGLMIASVAGYLVRIEFFVWQATLYQGWIKAVIDNLYPPYLFGSAPSAWTDKPVSVLYFLLTCLGLYGLAPRLLIALFYQSKKQPYRIDTRLYYYEALLRQLR